MRKYLQIFICAIVLSGSCFCAELAVIQKSKPCQIAVVDSASDKVIECANELAEYLGRIAKTGFNVIKVENISGVKNAIAVGTSKDFPEKSKQEKVELLGEEGFIIKSEKDILWLIGNSEIAMQHSIYSFLESIGCRWYFPDPVWYVIPEKKEIKVSIDLREKPSFDWRNIWYEYGPRTPKLKLDYENWRRYNRQGGSLRVSAGHSYQRYIPSKEFDKNPELFSLVGGERKPTQICISNPEVQKRVMEGVLNAFRKNPDAKMVSVEPNDGGGFCECENCQKLGSVSDQVFFLANLVAKEVKKEFPGKYVGLLAYHLHSNPPSFNLEPNVHVEVTTGFRGGIKLTLQQQAEEFRKLGASVGVYDYFSVYLWDWDMPGAAKAGRYRALGEFIKEMKKIGLTSYTAESCCNWGPNGIGYWLASKLMWNADLNVDELLEDFFENCFKKAKIPVRRIYERWAKGERHTPRTLKLALLDLEQAYQAEKDPAVCARLDRIAMYLHWLVLKMEYERITKVKADDEKIIGAAKELIVFSRRIMDTGLIHVFPMLFTKKTFGERLFPALMKIEGLDRQEVERWKKDRQDIPEAEEIRKLFSEDIRKFSDLQVVEISGKQYTGKIVPIIEKKPEMGKKFSGINESPLYLESGIYYFAGKKGEKLNLTYKPFPNHTVDCHWKLMTPEEKIITEGDVKAEKNQEATITIDIPEDGIHIFDPGTTYWKSCLITFDRRPLSIWAARAVEPGKPKKVPFKQWFPKGEVLYFFVPEGTYSFVIGFPVCRANTKVVIKDENGKTVFESDKVMAEDQISIVVPEKSDGQIWSISVWSLRNIIELYDIPPFLARHPLEILVPEDALKK